MPPSFSQACTVLGIREDSTRAEARSAYLRLAKTYHPDRAGGASDKFNDVVEAFACFAAKRGPEEHHGRGNVDRSFESASTVWEECGEKEDVDKEEEFRTAEVFTSVLGDVFARMAKGGTCVGTAGKPVRPKNGVAFEIPTGDFVWVRSGCTRENRGDSGTSFASPKKSEAWDPSLLFKKSGSVGESTVDSGMGSSMPKKNEAWDSTTFFKNSNAREEYMGVGSVPPKKTKAWDPSMLFKKSSGSSFFPQSPGQTSSLRFENWDYPIFTKCHEETMPTPSLNSERCPEKPFSEHVESAKTAVLTKLREWDIGGRFSRNLRKVEEAMKGGLQVKTTQSKSKETNELHKKLEELFGDALDDSLMADEVLMDIANNVALANKNR